MKEFADDNFKCDENARKLSKRVENSVGKKEIAHFPTVFSKGLFPRASKGVIVWEWVKKKIVYRALFFFLAEPYNSQNGK